PWPKELPPRAEQPPPAPADAPPSAAEAAPRPGLARLREVDVPPELVVPGPRLQPDARPRLALGVLDERVGELVPHAEVRDVERDEVGPGAGVDVDLVAREPADLGYVRVPHEERVRVLRLLEELLGEAVEVGIRGVLEHDLESLDQASATLAAERGEDAGLQELVDREGRQLEGEPGVEEEGALHVEVEGLDAIDVGALLLHLVEHLEDEDADR